MKSMHNDKGGAPDHEAEFLAHIQGVLNESHVSPARALKSAKIYARRYLAAGAIWPHIRFLFLCAEQSFYLGRIKDIESYIARAKSLESRLEDPHDRGRYFSQLGTYYAVTGQIAEAYSTLSRSLRLLEPIEPEGYAIGQTLNSLALAFDSSGDHHTALEYYLRTRRIWESIGHHQGLGISLREMGRLYLKLLHVDQARECFEQSIALHRAVGNHLNLAAAIEAVGRLYMNHGQPGHALELFEEALALFQGLRMPQQVGDIFNCIGNAQFLLGNYNEALRYAQMALEAVPPEEIWGLRVQVSAVVVIGTTYHRMNDPVAARAIIEPMIEAIESLREASFSAEAHRVLADVLESLGDVSGSLDHYKRFLEFYAEIHSAERQRAFAEVEARHALMDAVRKQEQLELRAARAEQEVREKENELRSLAMTILHRNEALKRLRSVVQTYSQRTVKDGELASIILENIDTAFEDHEEWKMFEEEFERVHYDFVRRLRDRCARLTPTELRICILTRLGLANKQIADALFISGVTVKTHRRHIRSKMGLATDGNLTSLLLSI